MRRDEIQNAARREERCQECAKKLSKSKARPRWHRSPREAILDK